MDLVLLCFDSFLRWWSILYCEAQWECHWTDHPTLILSFDTIMAENVSCPPDIHLSLIISITRIQVKSRYSVLFLKAIFPSVPLQPDVALSSNQWGMRNCWVRFLEDSFRKLFQWRMFLTELIFLSSTSLHPVMQLWWLNPQ